MPANAIRQAPGWWASLCRAECDDCGWRGPTRNVGELAGGIGVKRDKQRHRCGYDEYGFAPLEED